MSGFAEQAFVFEGQTDIQAVRPSEKDNSYGIEQAFSANMGDKRHFFLQPHRPGKRWPIASAFSASFVFERLQRLIATRQASGLPP